MMKEDFPDRTPPVLGLYNGFTPTLFIRDLEMIYDLYVRKNKYFDKEPLIYRMRYPLFGDSILFAPTNEEWAMRRKHMAAAFYKEKLIKFTEKIKQVACEKR